MQRAVCLICSEFEDSRKEVFFQKIGGDDDDTEDKVVWSVNRTGKNCEVSKCLRMTTVFGIFTRLDTAKD